jgi:hypothetical protein
VPYPDRAEIDATGIPNAKSCSGAMIRWRCSFCRSRVLAGFASMTAARCASPMPAPMAGPYTAIGRALITRGVLTAEAVSLASIRDWLKANPTLAQGVMELD